MRIFPRAVLAAALVISVPVLLSAPAAAQATLQDQSAASLAVVMDFLSNTAPDKVEAAATRLVAPNAVYISLNFDNPELKKIARPLFSQRDAMLLLTCFAIVAQRRLSACVDLFALQSLFLALTAACVAFLTGTPHIYYAAALTVVVKVIVIPRVLRRVIERLNVTRELVMNINVPASLLICGALVMVVEVLGSRVIGPSS